MMFELMEQIMGGRYTARGMWGERRKLRRYTGDEERSRASGWDDDVG
jgi:hypothetical protein